MHPRIEPEGNRLGSNPLFVSVLATYFVNGWNLTQPCNLLAQHFIRAPKVRCQRERSLPKTSTTQSSSGQPVLLTIHSSRPKFCPSRKTFGQGKHVLG